jgi:predicted nucleic acid-binding protein
LTAERGNKFKHAAHNLLRWYGERVKLVEPVPLGKQRSRDAKDDPYLACALAAGATIIVSRDEDLLALKKPFGIAILTPRELLTRLAREI